MRGGLERWKRGVGSQGVRQALAYAFQGSCDSHLRSASTGVDALTVYSDTEEAGVAWFIVEDGVVTSDVLDSIRLRRWVDGRDPETDEIRGRDLNLPTADLILDGTINAPKSFSVAALLTPDLAREFEALQDRLRHRVITTWQRELNARRGAGGRLREPLHRIEVVELQHRRSRALDPHIHRHLWLNVKVQGKDGKWSNVDSRVAMKLHTLINAEGELAARTDPAWVRALARHGYTLDVDGEIAELAHVVRPMSRRSNQIEANRAMLLAGWRTEHPGQEPSPDQLHRIDRLAWAKARPNKPGDLDEATWEELIRGELAAIDPAILHPRQPARVVPATFSELDRGLLAARAIVEADARAAGCGGRFSLVDVRAGATRAVAASGVVASRMELQPLIDDVVDRALDLTVELLETEPDRPQHVKGFMATATAALKVELATRFDELTHAGTAVDAAEVIAVAAQVLPQDAGLHDRQVQAAAAIAGTDRLVSVTGPAGAGKTTMLRVAGAVITRQGHRMVVVAPTKKAASVAGRELGAAASSLHALLADYGFRWDRDQAGAEAWTRLTPGDTDPTTGTPYAGPRRYLLGVGDRVVVDEAGMVDLHTANALAVVAAETGCGIAMVGDPLQARPVGHSGAMGCLTRRATAVVELTAVHRFHDPDYANLTLRMREPGTIENALQLAADLDGRGLIRRVPDQAAARELMVDEYFHWATDRHRVALVTSTNEEADAINEAIQQRRLDHGQLTAMRIAVGQGEQRLLEGDIVQTRRNDRTAGVENRALWTIHRITPDGIELASLSDSGDLRTVTHDYAAGHVHLAYASTVHGIQGETTDASIVGPGVDAAGLYVGMTRGRTRNIAIAIARSDDAARERVAESMLRGIPEISIDDSIRAARTELGRAARTPRDAAPVIVPPWNDRTRRPFGAELDLPRKLAIAQRRTGTLRNQLTETKAWLEHTKDTLLALDARIAARDAQSHAKAAAGAEDGGELGPSRDDLAAAHTARSDHYAQLVTEYRDASQRASLIEAEQHTRRQLTPAAGRAEDLARATAPGAPTAGPATKASLSR